MFIASSPQTKLAPLGAQCVDGKSLYRDDFHYAPKGAHENSLVAGEL
jgi:hypothetical protein